MSACNNFVIILWPAVFQRNSIGKMAVSEKIIKDKKVLVSCYRTDMTLKGQIQILLVKKRTVKRWPCKVML